MFKSFLKKLMDGNILTTEESYAAMELILKGEATPSQISSLISVITFRGVDAGELSGMARAMRDKALPVQVNVDGPLLDTCGTGGDGGRTLNVSTASALICAAGGLHVAKHGNRSVSSLSGSSDVLEVLGLDINVTPENIQDQLDQHRLCFMFAPFYHQALKHAAPTRKELGFRTVMNLLGPLTNPTGVRHQVIGVFDQQYSRLMAETLSALGSEHVLVVRGEDGLDELSISGSSAVTELLNGTIEEYTIAPEDVGLERYPLEEIQVDGPEESATLIRAILQGEDKGAPRAVVLLNAGAALYVGGKAGTIAEGVKIARELIDSGQAYDHFVRMKRAEGERQHA